MKIMHSIRREREKHLICGQLKIEKTSKEEKRLRFFSLPRDADIIDTVLFTPWVEKSDAC